MLELGVWRTRKSRAPTSCAKRRYFVIPYVFGWPICLICPCKCKRWRCEARLCDVTVKSGHVRQLTNHMLLELVMAKNNLTRTHLYQYPNATITTPLPHRKHRIHANCNTPGIALVTGRDANCCDVLMDIENCARGGAITFRVTVRKLHVSSCGPIVVFVSGEHLFVAWHLYQRATSMI